MAEVMVEAAIEEKAATEAADAEQRRTTLLLATDACCAAGHDTALVERSDGVVPALVCVTCTAMWGRLEELRNWQANWPDCFAKAHPEGLTDLGITARARVEDE